MSSYDLNEHPNADAGFRNFANAIGHVMPAMSVDTLRQERLATMARAYRDEDREGEGMDDTDRFDMRDGNDQEQWR